MKVTFKVTIEYDADAWAKTYGPNDDLSDDVVTHFVNVMQEGPEAEECGVTVVNHQRLTNHLSAPEGKKTDGRSTRWVFLNLDKDDPDYGLRCVYERFIDSTTPKEQFVDSAKRWLRDRSELGTHTIETADWDKIYDWYMGQVQ